MKFILKNIFLLSIISAANNTFSQLNQLGSDIDGYYGDRLGSAISLNTYGTYMAVGIPGYSSNGGVKVYHFVGNAWVQLAAGIWGDNQNMGKSVDISVNGYTVAVGMYGDDNGMVNVYHFQFGNWNLQDNQISINGSNDDDEFSLVRLNSDGTILAIGVPTNSTNGSQAGHASVYKYDGAEWVQMGSNILGATGDKLGTSISISADGYRIAVGSPLNSGFASGAGAVVIYDYIAGDWVQVGDTIYGQITGDHFGHSMSLSEDGSTVVIGAPDNDDAGNYSGAISVFEYSGGSWIQKGNDINGEAIGLSFGNSVDINGDGSRLIAGSLWADNGSILSCGQTKLYEYSGSDWIQVGPTIYGEAAGDQSSNSLSINGPGNVFAIGARYNDENALNAGHVRVYSTSNVGIDEPEELQFSLSPNPNNGEFYISTSEENVNVSIFSLDGKLIQEDLLITNQNQLISLKNIESGIYFAQLKKDDRQNFVRFVVN